MPTGGPFGSEPTFSVRSGPRSIEPATVRWTRQAAGARASERPTAPEPPRARALAVLVAFGIASLSALGAVATLWLRS